MKKVLLPCFLLYLLFPLSSLGEEVRIPDVVTFAAYDSPPWYIHSETGGKATGIIPHYTEQLASQTKYTAKVAPMPYQRVLTSTNDDNVDFVVSIEHPDLFKTAYPYMKLGRIAAVVYSAQSLNNFLAIKEKRKTKVGVLRGIIPLVHKLVPKEITDTWDISEFNTEESGFLAAQLGRLDAAILTKNVYEYLVEQQGGDNPGYAEDLGFFTVFAWLPKRIQLNHELITMRNKIETLTHDGKIVLDWRTALNQFVTDTDHERRMTPQKIDTRENTELNDLLSKIKEARK